MLELQQIFYLYFTQHVYCILRVFYLSESIFKKYVLFENVLFSYLPDSTF